ncbi:hypothetical protein llap_7109 [Limosa lapponica baueri]|uniref:Uncharacterized protein n=1 Tax=Limosa lapponica baueri TaxID=1758121 RepID=A0A2I0U952_LIMLA|nr:hypothetical protein llap_7109 [Limosa lapponica baueri]
MIDHQTKEVKQDALTEALNLTVFKFFILLVTECPDWLQTHGYQDSSEANFTNLLDGVTPILHQCHRMLMGESGQEAYFDSSHAKMKKINFNAQGKKLLLEKVTHHYKLFHYRAVLEGILQKLVQVGIVLHPDPNQKNVNVTINFKKAIISTFCPLD